MAVIINCQRHPNILPETTSIHNQKKMKRLLLAAALLTVLPCLPAAANTPRCDYVSYIVKDNQCIDLTLGSLLGLYGRLVADEAMQNNPIALRDMKIRQLPNSNLYALTGEAFNQSRRSIDGGVIATVGIYRKSNNQILATEEVVIPQNLRSGAVAPFRVLIIKAPGAVYPQLESVRRF